MLYQINCRISLILTVALFTAWRAWRQKRPLINSDLTPTCNAVRLGRNFVQSHLYSCLTTLLGLDWVGTSPSTIKPIHYSTATRPHLIWPFPAQPDRSNYDLIYVNVLINEHLSLKIRRLFTGKHHIVIHDNLYATGRSSTNRSLISVFGLCELQKTSTGYYIDAA